MGCYIILTLHDTNTFCNMKYMYLVTNNDNNDELARNHIYSTISFYLLMNYLKILKPYHMNFLYISDLEDQGNYFMIIFFFTTTLEFVSANLVRSRI